MRTVLTGLILAAFSTMLFSGCEPGLKRDHALAIAKGAVDDVTYWNTVIATDAHRAAVKIMASIPELVAELPEKAKDERVSDVLS